MSTPTPTTADPNTVCVTKHEHPFDLDASLLALDYVNTVPERGLGLPDDLLESYGDLVLFGVAAEALSEEAARILLTSAASQADAAQTVLEQGRALREDLFTIFSAIAAKDTPDDAALARLSRVHRDLQRGTRIVAAGDHFHEEWIDPSDLRRALWPACSSAVELLLHGPVERVRECASDTCRWMFLDVSRNHSRRWCSMKSCGNRAKVAGFRERERSRSRTES